MRTFLKKCCIALGLFLFFAIILPFPNMGNTKAAASVVETEQTEIKLNVKSKSIIKDATFALKVYNVANNQKIFFKSSSTSIATVDESGTITAVDFGTATISVTVKEGLKTISTQECQITVGPPAISVKLTKSELTLEVGDRTTLMAILKPNNTVEEARFVSNDHTIASVSIGGQVTAKSAGVTYIFASISNGKYDVCKVTVVEKSTTDTSAAK